MLYMLLGYLHAATWRRVKEIRRLAGETGQGTVEYVGLILLVALLMVGMVAGMKGFQGKQGTELADVIVNCFKEMYLSDRTERPGCNIACAPV